VAGRLGHGVRSCASGVRWSVRWFRVTGVVALSDVVLSLGFRGVVTGSLPLRQPVPHCVSAGHLSYEPVPWGGDRGTGYPPVGDGFGTGY
jgi:hypothetical protein